MKKYSLLKVIGITVLLFVILTWIIPAGTYVSGQFVDKGYQPIGLFSIFLAPFHFFNWVFINKQYLPDGSIELFSYSSIIFAFLSIGIFYKVINKTGAYGHLIEDIVKKFKNKKEQVLIYTTIFFVLFSSFTGLSLIAFLLIPFFITVLRKFKFSKITAFGATVLALLVGRITAITAYDITGISNKVFNLDISSEIITKIILLVVLTFVLLFYILFKKSDTNDTEEDLLYDDIVKKEKSYFPLIFLSLVAFIVLCICMYNWYYVFDTIGVTESYEVFMGYTMGSYPIVQNIFGTMEPFGYWTGFTMSGILIIMSLTIGFVYSLKFEDLVESALSGIKAMGKTVIYIILAFSVMIFLSQSDGNIFYTISNWISNNITTMTVPFSALVSGIQGFFVNDFFLLSSHLYFALPFEDFSLAVLTAQVISGTIAIIAPTSIFLVAGLAYLEIPYKKWISYIWKLLLIILAINLIVLFTVSVI